MNMKRKIAMALTLIMMMALILPQTALAVTRNYVEVSITEAKEPHNTVTKSSGYLDPAVASLAGTVAEIVAANKDALEVFGSPTMKAIVLEGIRNKDDATAWNTWATSKGAPVEDTGANVGLKTLLQSMDNKVNALTANAAYKIQYAPTGVDSGDRANGNTYTVTVTWVSYTNDSGSGTSTPASKVEVKDGANGSASVSPANASKGQKVTVTVKPDEGYVPSRILVTDKDGNTIRATYEGNNKYSFTMPVGGATVTPVFRKQTASPAETGVAELLNADDHVAFMVGDDKGNFRPNDSITRAEVAQIFYRLLKNQSVAVTRNFDDVASDAWYAAAVNTLASMGILNGTSATAFEPERAITRAEFTAICTRFAKELKGTKSFTDVPESFWAYNNIAAAAEFGWILGDGTGKFNPNADITRAEAAAIVNRMLGRLSDFDAIDAGDGKSFPDVSESFWGFYNIAEATSGHDHSFDSEKLHEDWK